MGRAKQTMMEHESKVNSLLGRLETAGAVQECENHDYPIDQDDSEAVDEEKAVRLVEDAMA